jgi:hypothetical protein
MHGGGSTGPRTAEGLARLRAARTTHGGYTPEARAFQRHVLTTLRRNQTFVVAMRYRDRLPPGLAERLLTLPPELALPPYPAAGLSVAEDRILLHAEREALAPWKDAIAAAKNAGCMRTGTASAMPGLHAPERPASAVLADVSAIDAAGAMDAQLPAGPHAPDQATDAAVPTGSVPVPASSGPHTPEQGTDAAVLNSPAPAVASPGPHTPDRATDTAVLNSPASAMASPGPHTPEPAADAAVLTGPASTMASSGPHTPEQGTSGDANARHDSRSPAADAARVMAGRPGPVRTAMTAAGMAGQGEIAPSTQTPARPHAPCRPASARSSATVPLAGAAKADAPARAPAIGAVRERPLAPERPRVSAAQPGPGPLAPEHLSAAQRWETAGQATPARGTGLRRTCLDTTHHGTLALMTEGAGGLGVVTGVLAKWLRTGVPSL